MWLGETADVLASDPGSQTVPATEIRGSGLRMTEPRAAIAKPLPALSGSYRDVAGEVDTESLERALPAQVIADAR